MDPGIETIDDNAPLTAQGLDSISTAAVAIEVEKATGVRLSPELFYEYGTINRLAAYLTGQPVAVQGQAHQASTVERLTQESDVDPTQTFAPLLAPVKIAIRSAVTTEERVMVYRFRYAIYIEEKRRHIENTDHVRRLITDSLDATGRIIVAFDPSGNVVGSLRVNLLRESGGGSFRERYQLGQLNSAEAASASISTRFVIAREHRGSDLTVRILRHACKILLTEGITRDYAACRSDGLPFFTGLGYKVRYQWIDPDGVEFVAIYLDVTDLEHLRTINSPLLPVIEHHME